LALYRDTGINFCYVNDLVAPVVVIEPNQSESGEEPSSTLGALVEYDDTSSGDVENEGSGVEGSGEKEADDADYMDYFLMKERETKRSVTGLNRKGTEDHIGKTEWLERVIRSAVEELVGESTEIMQCGDNLFDEAQCIGCGCCYNRRHQPNCYHSLGQLCLGYTVLELGNESSTES
jgi:hypothetical protein